MTSLTPERWVRQALCVTRPINPDAFHPGKRTRRSEVAAALALCAQCPVRGQCLQNALDHEDPWGIWGGTTEEQRAVMLRNAA
ncbi:MAG: WhiB family transcriptional regulator [Frankiaceae bacterium]|nr:WhiB family transcriptional regulator [Frankiaceae bacterium]